MEDLLTGVIPSIQAHYRARTDRDGRAVAGFSFGGAQALWAGTEHPEQFAWLGLFAMGIQGGSHTPAPSIAGSGSSLTPDKFVTAHPAFFTWSSGDDKSMRLVWVGAGRDDKIVVDGPKQLAATLATHGIRSEYHEYDGGHFEIMSGGSFRDFAAMLFH